MEESLTITAPPIDDERELSVEVLPRAERRRDHLAALTGLRFFLAVWVILHHLTGKGMLLEPFVNTLPAALQELARAGYLAVGIFFILSGFVLMRTYGEEQWNRSGLVRYGVARMARVYPGYVLSLVIVSPFIWRSVFGGGGTLRRTELLTDYGLILQGWTGPLGVGWNTPAWSLSCELFFYLLFPALVWFFGKRTPLRMALAAGMAIVLPLGLAQMHVPAWWKPLHHSADFLIGIMASQLFDVMVERGWNVKRIGAWLYGIAFPSAALLIVFPQFVRGPFLDVSGALRPFNVAILVGLATGGGLTARLLSTRLVKFLGQASYSLYILHIPLLWWVPKQWMQGFSTATLTAVAAGYILFAIAVSAVVFRYFEEPANRMIRRWARRKAED